MNSIKTMAATLPANHISTVDLRYNTATGCSIRACGVAGPSHAALAAAFAAGSSFVRASRSVTSSRARMESDTFRENYATRCFGCKAVTFCEIRTCRNREVNRTGGYPEKSAARCANGRGKRLVVLNDDAARPLPDHPLRSHLPQVARAWPMAPGPARRRAVARRAAPKAGPPGRRNPSYHVPAAGCTALFRRRCRQSLSRFAVGALPGSVLQANRVVEAAPSSTAMLAICR